MRNNGKAAMLLGGALGLSAVHMYANKAEKPVTYTTEEARAIAATRLINERDRWKSLLSWLRRQSEASGSNPEARVDCAALVRRYVEEGGPNHPDWNNIGQHISLIRGGVYIDARVDYTLSRINDLLKNIDQLSDKAIKSFVSETDSHQCMLSDVSKLYQTAKFEEEHPSLTKKIADGAKKFVRSVAVAGSTYAHRAAFNIAVVGANCAARFTDWYGLNLLCLPLDVLKVARSVVFPWAPVKLDAYQDHRLSRLGWKKGLLLINESDEKVAKDLGFDDWSGPRYVVKDSKIKESGGYFFDVERSYDSW